MNNEVRRLLNEVMEDRLIKALNANGRSEESEGAFKEAMIAVDKLIELEQLKVSEKKADLEHLRSLREEEFKKKEAKKNAIIRAVELGGSVVLAPVVEFVTKKAYAKMLCIFEKDYTFTTTAGRQLSSLFRFKK